MCGQFLAFKEWVDFLKTLGMTDDFIGEWLPLVIKPSMDYPIITAGFGLKTAAWGLKPVWAGPEFKSSTFNARLETAADKPAFRDAYAHRRALVAIAGFHEWSGPAKGRQKWQIRRRDDEPLVLAGLWEGDTFTILTREAGPQMRQIHDREPVVVGRRQWQDWLSAPCDLTLPPADFYRIDPADGAPVQAALF